MTHCIKCLSPETLESISFDENGICSICNQIEYKKSNVDWTERKKWLDELISEFKGKNLYDCIIPYSGGKDSVFQLWYVVRKLGLKPLVVRYDHWGYRPLIDENNEKVFKQLGVDVIKFTPNWNLVKDLMLEALKLTGDFCWHCHTGIYGHTMQIALRYNVPLLLWGESIAEYMSYYTYEEMEQVDKDRFDKIMSMGITANDMCKALEGKYDKRDLYPFTYPDPAELEKIGCKSVCLGNYIEWNTRRNAEVIKQELGWKGHEVEGIPPQYDYEKIECKWQGVRDYCKFVKRGFGRTNHLCAIDVRNNVLTTSEALVLNETYDGKRPKTLDLFLKTLNITEDEFYKILKPHEVVPWVFDKDKIQDGKELYDMKQWDTTI